MIGETVSHYRITRELGAGGMGVVYEAVDTRLDRTVALKFLPPESTRDPEAKARFIHEAKAASALDHPNVCNIHEIDETDDGRLFLAMARYEGETLKDTIQRGPLPLDAALDITRQVAEGLAEAHARDIVHRDIKPANIFLTEGGLVKILDFGLAKLAGMTRLTREGTTVGTGQYMSPEQAAGRKMDSRTDLWSLGVVLYEMVTGRVPFGGDHLQAVMYAIQSTEPEPVTGVRTGVPLELERIIGKALRKDPTLRYQSARGLIADMHALEQAGPGSLSETLQLDATRRRSVGLRAGVGVALAAVVIALGVLAFKMWLPQAPSEPGSKEPKLAVLVFRNLGAPGHLEYLAAGISEDLIVNLSGISGLSVLSRGAVEQFRDKVSDPREVGEVLGCDYVLDGSVRVMAESLKITAMLVDAHGGAQVWARSFDAAPDEIFALQDSIQTDVAIALNLLDTGKESAIVSPRWTRNAEAYGLFLAGREEMWDLNEKLYADPQRWFKKALAIDSHYVPALAGLSSAIIFSRFILGHHEPGYWSRALELARRAKELDPDHALAWQAEARVLDFWKNSEALDRLQRAKELNPNLPETYWHMGMIYRDEGQYDKAEEILRKGLAIDPYFGQLYEILKDVYIATGKYDEALGTMENALMVLPDSPYMMNERAGALRASGRNQEAVEAYREIISGHPDYYWAYRSLGRLLRETGHFSEADSVYDAACSRWDSSSRVPGDAGAHYMVRGQLDRAESLYRKAIGIDQYNIVARIELAECLYRAGREDEASTEIESVESDWPPDPQYAWELARYHRMLTGDLDQAENWAHVGLELVPDSVPFLKELAYIDYSRSRHDSAVSHLERVLEVSPRDYRSWNFLAVIQAYDGQWEAAIKSAKACVEVNPSYSDGWETLGQIYLANGQRHQAAVAFERILETAGDRLYEVAGAVTGLARIYYYEGRFQQAIDAYRRSLGASDYYDEICWSNIADIARDILGDVNEASLACEELVKPVRGAEARARGLQLKALIEAEGGGRAVADSLLAEAWEVASAGLEESPEDFNLILLAAVIQAHLGHEEQARVELARYEERAGDVVGGQVNIVRALSALGDYDAALDHLEIAIDLGLDYTAPLEASRDLAALREEPRFEELISSIR